MRQAVAPPLSGTGDPARLANRDLTSAADPRACHKTRRPSAIKCVRREAGTHEPVCSARSLRKPEACTDRTRRSLLFAALAPVLGALGLFAVATVGLSISVTHAGAHSIPDASACVSIYWTGEEPCHLADHKNTVSRGWEAGNICSETIELHWGDNAHDSPIELYEAATPLRPGEVFGSHIACVDKPHLSWCADYTDEELKGLDGECE